MNIPQKAIKQRCNIMIHGMHLIMKIGQQKQITCLQTTHEQ